MMSKKNKVALLILASSNINVLNLLLKKFDDEKFDIFIHLDRKCLKNKDRIKLPSNANILKESFDVSWGGFNMVEATFSMFKIAESDVYSHYALVSDSCYPISSSQKLYEYLEEDVSYINIGSDTITPSHPFFDRYYKYWLMDVPIGNPKGNALVENKDYLNKFLGTLGYRNGVAGFDFKVGSQWMCISSNVMFYLLHEMSNELYEYFRYSKIADECLIQTFVNKLVEDNKVPSESIKSNLHFIDFENEGRIPGLPRVMDETDFQRLMESNKFFTRKLDFESSHELINKLNGLTEK